MKLGGGEVLATGVLAAGPVAEKRAEIQASGNLRWWTARTFSCVERDDRWTLLQAADERNYRAAAIVRNSKL